MFLTFYYLFANIKQTNGSTIGLGIACGALIIFLKEFKYTSLIPGPLVVVVIGTLLSWSLDLSSRGVSIVGDVEKGFPPIQLLQFSVLKENWSNILITSLLVCLIGFLEAFSIGKTFAIKRKTHLDANNELRAVGISNMIGSLFSCFPTTGSFSRTAINARAGAKTQISNLVLLF